MAGWPVYSLGFFSGVLALGYEVLWTRQLLNLFGSTTTATASMLAAFMAGMAVGAGLAAKASPSLLRPLRIYAILEGGLALYGLEISWVIDFSSTLIPAGHIAWAGAFDVTLALWAIGHSIVLLLPTALMGAALPVLAQGLQMRGAARPRHLAMLYGVNTLGGAAGVFATGFVLLPAAGAAHSQLALSALALAVAGAALAVDATRRGAPLVDGSPERNEPDVATTGVGPFHLRLAIVLSGVAALGYELIWTRILVLVAGSSVYAFTMMLGTYILGLAAGGFWIGRTIDRLRSPAAALQHLQLAIAAASLMGIWLFGHLPTIALAGISSLGTTPLEIALVNFAVAGLMVFAPTFLIGAALPVAARLLQRGPPERGRELGTAFGWAALGHVGGILITAAVLIPAIGLQHGILALAAANVAAGLALLIGQAGRSRGNTVTVTVLIMALGMAALLTPPWNTTLMTSGVYRQAPAYLNLLGSWEGLERAFARYKTLFYAEGSEAVVSVFETPSLSGRRHIVLAIDGKVDASTGADMSTQVLSGHLPMLYRPAAKRALVIGLASGITVGSLIKHPLDQVDVVEIERKVVESSKAFDSFSGAPLKNSRVNVVVEDGRHYLRTTKTEYDIIISEPSNPWLSSSARLFTREFFLFARQRLTPDGVLVQWVPLYGLSPVQFKTLLRTLVEVFPEVSIFRVSASDLVAVSGVAPLEPSPQWFQAAFSRPFVGDDLRRVGVGSPDELLARWVADETGLRTALGPGPINTDDNGLLEFGSPWYVLQDTRSENLAFLEGVGERSNIASALVTQWSRPGIGSAALMRIASQYIAQGQAGMVRVLANALDRSGKRLEADVIRGEAAFHHGDLEAAYRFWLPHADDPALRPRLGTLELLRGNPGQAVAHFERNASGLGNAAHRLDYALALAALSRSANALNVLGTMSEEPRTPGALLDAFVRTYLLEVTARASEAARERLTLARGTDALRQRLEIEQGEQDLDAIIHWIRERERMLPPQLVEELQSTLTLQITAPMAYYYRGVRHFWLGEHAAAAAEFGKYLAMLPAEAASKANQFLAEGGQPSASGR